MSAAKIFAPSPQQAAVLDWTSNGSGSAIVEAVAGAGKTTTLIELLKRTTGSVAFCAYNKKIADEIGAKVAPLELGNRVRVGTVHSFGYAALKTAYPALKNRENIDSKKLETLLNKMDAIHPDLHPFALAAVRMAKQVGIGAIVPASSREAWLTMVEHHDLESLLPEGDEEKTGMIPGLRAACLLLKKSNEVIPEVIDFDDMVYGPIQRSLRIWRNDWVLVDEAQDTNPTRRALLRMMLTPKGRLVAVGDPRQAVYGFTGADSDSLDIISREFNTTRLPLTTTYRCPKKVVAVAHRWVSHIQAAETAPEGEVSDIGEAEFWGTKETPGLYASLGPTDAVICRNTKPLVKLAYALIRNKIGCRVEGRDIGTGLIKLATRWKKSKTIGSLREKLQVYQDKEMAKALAKNQETRAASIEDQCDTLREVMSQFADDDSVVLLTESINSLFGDTKPGEIPKVVTLSTIHKSKGREWDRVFVWGLDEFIPSKWARKEWQLGQEWNLAYVAVTRSMRELVIVGAAA